MSSAILFYGGSLFFFFFKGTRFFLIQTEYLEPEDLQQHKAAQRICSANTTCPFELIQNQPCHSLLTMHEGGGG